MKKVGGFLLGIVALVVIISMFGGGSEDAKAPSDGKSVAFEEEVAASPSKASSTRTPSGRSLPDNEETENPTRKPIASGGAVVTSTPEPTSTPKPTKAPPMHDYVVNTNTGKIHKPSCSSARDMSNANRWEVYCSYQELIEMGYTPCGRCHPN